MGEMKPISIHLSLRTLTAAALLFGAASGGAFAQEKDKPAPASNAQEQSTRLDFNFDPGGKPTVQEAANVILSGFRKAGQPVNLIVRGGGGSFPVPPINLQHVTFKQAVEALVLTATPQLSYEGSGNLFVIQTNPTADSQTKMKVFNVSLYLQRPIWPEDEKRRKIEEERYKERFNSLQNAIQQGISISQKFNSKVKQPEIDFADASGLLFATGNPEALEIVGEVVRALCDPHLPPTPQAVP